MIKGDNIRQIREEKGMSQAALARACGISNDYMHKIESGKATNIGSDVLAALVKALDTTLDKFSDFESILSHPDSFTESKHKDNFFTLDKFAIIPLLSGTVYASEFRHSFNDWEGERVSVPIKDGKNKVAWRVQGRSMEPEFNDGDIVVIDNAVTFLDGDIVVAENDSGVTIKKLKLHQDGSAELRPLNADFKTIHIDSSDKLQILGVVVYTIKKVKRRK
jgi:SOS-response transcriptional repressor LexA